MYHVHNHYVKLEGVDVSELTSVEEVLGSSNSVLVSRIQDIAKMHQTVISRILGMGCVVPLDLLYNCVVVLTEQLEIMDGDNNSHDVIRIVSDTKAIVMELLERQYTEINSLESQLNEGRSSNITEAQYDATATQSHQEVTTESAVQPPDIYDSLIVALEFIQVVLEKKQQQHQSIDIDVELMCDQLYLFETKLHRYYETNNTDTNTAMLATISEEQVQKWKILVLAIRSIEEDPIEYWKDVINEPSLNFNSHEIIIGCIELYLSMNDETISPEQEWELLSFINELYKCQQALVNQRLTTEAKGDDGGLGNALVQMSGLMISRGDLEMERRQVPYKQEVDELLKNNGIAYYKNAITYAQRSGGLRERIIDKLQRQRKAKEASTKLKILDGTVTEAELVFVFGDDWKEELDMFE